MIRSLAVHDSSTAIAGEVTLGPDVATFAHQSPMLPDDNRHTQNFDSSLTVYNQSAQPQAFFMTQELPQFAPTATVLEKLYSVIYETCRKITNGTGMATFILKANEYSTPDINMAYVITGYSDDPLDLVDGVHSSDAMPIELYQEGHDLAPSCCTMTMSGQAGVAPYFVKGQMGARVAKLLTGNELFISTDSSFGGDDIRKLHPEYLRVFVTLAVLVEPKDIQVIPSWGLVCAITGTSNRSFLYASGLHLLARRIGCGSVTYGTAFLASEDLDTSAMSLQNLQMQRQHSLNLAKICSRPLALRTHSALVCNDSTDCSG
jgi:hypothetical protein